MCKRTGTKCLGAAFAQEGRNVQKDSHPFTHSQLVTRFSVTACRCRLSLSVCLLCLPARARGVRVEGTPPSHRDRQPIDGR